MAEETTIKDSLELFIYYKIKKAMRENKITHEALSVEFGITKPGFSQRLLRGNYRYVFLRKLFPILKLDLQKVTEEYLAIKQKKSN